MVEAIAAADDIVVNKSPAGSTMTDEGRAEISNDSSLYQGPRDILNIDNNNNDKDDEAATEGTDGSVNGNNDDDDLETEAAAAAARAIVSNSKKSRPPYKYDPSKITLRFLFANRDGLTVTIECDPNDTVAQAKGALLSVWPEDLPDCSGSDRIRLICMGKGYLMPDSKTLADCQIPTFKTHPTPINVTVRPESAAEEASSKRSKGGKELDGGGSSDLAAAAANSSPISQGCGCTIL
ncbi:hypothetical protein MPSEU_000145600 [Mayamaea pseudoterrestris]|nr:hypothetical protein MPSEU_000145600 [Mayamaea pseudoterrestris]